MYVLRKIYVLATNEHNPQNWDTMILSLNNLSENPTTVAAAAALTPSSPVQGNYAILMNGMKITVLECYNKKKIR